MTLSPCKVRLPRQARGALVPPISGVPILLGANKVEDEEDNKFIG